MRIVRIQVPAGLGPRVMEAAFSAGIEEISTRSETVRHRDGREQPVEVLDFSVATPKARKAVEAITAADFYDFNSCSIAVRQARSLVGKQPFCEITRPLCEPSSDLAQELWQFSHITTGLFARTVLAGCLLGYGLLRDQILLIIAGLMFIPLLPIVAGVSFGAVMRQFDLARRALGAFAVVLVCLFATGLVVGLLVGGSIQHIPRESITVSALISLAVGLAAAFGTIDDAGRREMLGLAAASQLALFPCWIGLALGTGTQVAIAPRIASMVLNPLVLGLAAAAGYALLGYRAHPPHLHS